MIFWYHSKTTYYDRIRVKRKDYLDNPTYDINEEKLDCQERYAPLKPIEEIIKLRILVDRTTLEIFANDGQIYMPIRTPIKISDITEISSKWSTDFNISEMIDQYPHKINFLVPYTQPVYLGKGDILAFSEGGKTKLVKMEVHELNSIW